jgi:hypothetical protein
MSKIWMILDMRKAMWTYGNFKEKASRAPKL